MKIMVRNRYNLKEEDMTETVQRVKILMFNEDDEMLLCYSNKQYFLPGGHVEENETLEETLRRELKEETGIDYNDKIPEPFLKQEGYYKDWPEEGKNRKIEIYYYAVNTNEKPNDDTNLTEGEKAGGFTLEYVPFSKVEETFKENANEYGDTKGIASEMLEVLKIYKELCR